MDFNPRYELCEAADVLEQLAILVEESGLSAADVGELIWNSHEHSAMPLSDPALRDLQELRDSQTTTTKFVAGLRRQARQLRDRAGVGV